MSNVTSVLIVGVGGQGTLLASRLLGKTMMDLGYDVKVSEVHGMSQRGGSVETYVRYGDRVYSPVIDPGEADVVLAFEQLEAARFLPFLKKGGTVITNTQKIDPMPVVAGSAQYPEGLLEEIKAQGARVLAAGCACSCGAGRFRQGGQRGAHRRHGENARHGAGHLAQVHRGHRAAQICGDEQARL